MASQIFFKRGSNEIVREPELESVFGLSATTDPSLVNVEEVVIDSDANPEGYDIEFAQELKVATFPSLESLEASGILKFHYCTVLHTVEVPKLIDIGGEVTFTDCTALLSVSFSKLQTVGGLTITGCTALRVFKAPSLVEVTGDVALSDNAIEEIDADTCAAFDTAVTGDIDLSGNALTNDAIQVLCEALVTTWGALSKTLDISGGTSAIPSGAAATAVSALEGEGATVTVNS